MMAAFGGHDIRCAGYARYGTAELSELALAALEGRNGCLLANHGMIAVGPNLDKAMWLAVELETIARPILSLARARDAAHSQPGTDSGDGTGIFDLWSPGPEAKVREGTPRRESRSPPTGREEAQRDAMTAAAPGRGRDHGLVDVAIIGGGINGAGIARDAAGRGLKVLLCEKDDFAEGTSSRSGKLVHGGLRYLEYYEFRLVRRP